jgi:hypothetical protein
VLPRTMCLTCLTLMWMESALGLCVGRKIHGLMVRRGWTTKGHAFELCAEGACDPPARQPLPSASEAAVDSLPQRSGR